MSPMWIYMFPLCCPGGLCRTECPDLLLLNAPYHPPPAAVPCSSGPVPKHSKVLFPSTQPAELAVPVPVDEDIRHVWNHPPPLFTCWTCHTHRPCTSEV